MNKKTQGILAGSAGAALLIGGGTFALWSDSAQVENTYIATGNLQIVTAECEDSGWWDTSDDRSDAGHEIEIAGAEGEWKAVPGDTAKGIFCFSAALEGDNIVAAINAKADDIDPNPPEDRVAPAAVVDVNRLEVTWELEYLNEDERWVAVDPEAALFTSEDNTNNVSELPTLPAEVDPAAGNLRVVTTVLVGNTETLGGSGQNQNIWMNGRIPLAQIDVTLTQVRLPDAAGQGGFNS